MGRSSINTVVYQGTAQAILTHQEVDNVCGYERVSLYRDVVTHDYPREVVI